jgi:hypothetical protein
MKMMVVARWWKPGDDADEDECVERVDDGRRIELDGEQYEAVQDGKWWQRRREQPMVASEVRPQQEQQRRQR